MEAHRPWSFLYGQPFLVQERPQAIFSQDSRDRLQVVPLSLSRRVRRERKPRKKMAAIRAAIFSHGFLSRRTRRLSERGTSLVIVNRGEWL